MLYPRSRIYVFTEFHSVSYLSKEITNEPRYPHCLHRYRDPSPAVKSVQRSVLRHLGQWRGGVIGEVRLICVVLVMDDDERFVTFSLNTA